MDDFDGQCCRTYPYNHSKIQRWREERRRRGEEKRAKESKEARREKEQREMSKQHLDTIPSQAAVKELVSSSIETGVRTGEPITTSAGKKNASDWPSCVRSSYWLSGECITVPSIEH